MHTDCYLYSLNSPDPSSNRVQEELNAKLIQLIEENEGVTSIRALLNQGADVNCKDAEGNTALMLAAMRGNFDVVNELLARKANINLHNDHGDTALILTILNGHLPIVKILLKYGASINEKNSDGEYTPLMLAVLHNKEEIVETLLEYNPDLELGNVDGDTALIFACTENLFPIVELLLKKRALPDTSNNENNSPLFLATACGYYDIVEKLLECGAEVDRQNSNEVTALYIAVQKEHLSIVKLLLNKGASPKSGQTNGNSPLAIGSFKGFRKVVEELLKQGGDILDMSDKHHAPPINARLLGHGDLLEDLLEKMTLEQKKVYKEALRIISLAHMTHQDGKVNLRFIDSTLAPKQVMLGSGHASYWIRKIKKSLPLLGKHALHLYPPKEMDRLESFLDWGTNPIPSEIYNGFKKGHPILLLTGWRGQSGHASTVVISRPYFLSCNNSAATPIQMYKFDADSLSLRTIQKLLSLSDLPKEQFQKVFLQEIPKELKLESSSRSDIEQLDIFLPSKCPLSRQRAKNCSYASLEQAIWAYFALNSLLPKDKSSAPSPNEAVNIATNKFYTLISINQIYNLERYIGTRLFRPTNQYKPENSLLSNRDLILIDHEFVVASIAEIRKSLEFIEPELKSELNKTVELLEQQSRQLLSKQLNQ